MKKNNRLIERYKISQLGAKPSQNLHTSHTSSVRNFLDHSPMREDQSETFEAAAEGIKGPIFHALKDNSCIEPVL